MRSQMYRSRYVFIIGTIVSVLLPALVRYVTTGIPITFSTQYNTAIGGSIAFILGVMAYRRLHVFPGIAAGSYIVMSLAVTFGVLAIAFFMMRIDYSRFQFASSFALAILFNLFVHQMLLRQHRIRIGVVPCSSIGNLPRFENVEWVRLSLDQAPADSRIDMAVVDLHTDHSDEWNQQITRYAMNAIPVYHFMQVLEQLSGRVEIRHLSENTLGSLNPNDVYLKIKGAIDIALAAIMLVFTMPVIVLVGILVRLDSQGPAIFRQTRVGYRGQHFTIYKIRTMRVAQPSTAGLSDEKSRYDAMTQAGDPRITRLGAFLRRTRLDELPQLFNIARGDMSLIGPRPEAIPLSQWYEREIPFYHYRHLIKPGVTGWAQVNQGHVTDVSDAKEKLHLDFYYVKNISLWLDIIIIIKTVKTVLSGHGAK